MRPFLKTMYKYFNVAIFTAGAKEYAHKVVDSLDPKKELIFNILHRDHCISHREGDFIKDLRIIENFDPKRMVIVDNKLISFSFQIHNGIPVLPFFGDKEDSELKYLGLYLKELSKCKDFSAVLKRRYDYTSLSKIDFKTLIKELVDSSQLSKDREVEKVKK